MIDFLNNLFKPREWQGAELLTDEAKNRLLEAFRTLNASDEERARQLREEVVRALLFSAVLAVQETPPGLTTLHLYGGGTIHICPDD